MEKKNQPEVVEDEKPEPKLEQKPVNKPKPIVSTPIPGTVWCVVRTDVGKCYFYNPSKRQSVWKRPEELKNRPDVDQLLSTKPKVNTEKVEEKDLQEEPLSKNLKPEVEMQEVNEGSISEVSQHIVLGKEIANETGNQVLSHGIMNKEEQDEKLYSSSLTEESESSSETAIDDFKQFLTEEMKMTNLKQGSQQNKKWKLSETISDSPTEKKPTFSIPQPSAATNVNTPNKEKQMLHGQTPKQKGQTPKQQVSQTSDNQKEQTPTQQKGQTPIQQKGQPPKQLKGQIPQLKVLTPDQEKRQILKQQKAVVTSLTIQSSAKENSKASKSAKKANTDDDEEEMTVVDLFKRQFEAEVENEDFSEGDGDEKDDDDMVKEEGSDEKDVEGDNNDEDGDSEGDDKKVQPASKKARIEKETVSNNKAKTNIEKEPASKQEKANSSGDAPESTTCGNLDTQVLFIKNLPLNCTVEEIKALSEDILEVRLRGLFTSSGKSREGPKFAYLVFASEVAAQKNHAILTKSAIRGTKLVVDYIGEKSNFLKNTTKPPLEEIDPLKLFVDGLPMGTVEADLRQFFPEATRIAIPIRHKKKKVLGFAFVSFATQDLAEQYFIKNQNISLKDVTLDVEFARKYDDKNGTEKQQAEKEHFYSAAKKAKLDDDDVNYDYVDLNAERKRERDYVETLSRGIR